MAAAYVANWIAANAALAGTWLIMQAQAADIERWLGGSVLLLVSVYLVRWALKVSAANEASTRSALDACNKRAEQAEARLDEVYRKYDTERRLRLDLEALGCTDERHHERRHDPREEPE